MCACLVCMEYVISEGVSIESKTLSRVLKFKLLIYVHICICMDYVMWLELAVSHFVCFIPSNGHKI